ncbi:uncharacterized protein AMSG_08217 [Thecamonas trahens ATCC 50062]|uniref:BSD domain-containing protein n=1 Tax=Thecamonas trahens ATCC 50062 TaxID=461836 RepID=A0A0L0DHX3_THETB|nr:hypothetical protein AMSG_08217 [Thecamonas trahens ATCC 50062]KNC51969.1 hypothetical protein AMSG_08217 [Thecamonas trahens ATCC 50062]|eukprot:XP_013755556.1 hypothetical protein AMSG_08217 [Thecamonas trahens ATCC 50062]
MSDWRRKDEEVILRSTVRMGKELGELVLSSQRVLFFGQRRSRPIQIEVPTIVKHFVSTPSTPAILLKIEVASGKAYTFEFVSDAREAERDRIKLELANMRSALQERLARAEAIGASASGSENAANKGAVDKVMAASSRDTEYRLALLAKDKGLAELHAQLVGTDAITDDEFWESRKELVARERLAPERQHVGMSTELLADVRPKAQNSTHIQFSITPEVIHHIFLENPHVHLAYKELVPAKMDKVAFWTKYFNHYYLHQNNANRAGIIDKIDTHNVRFRRLTDPSVETASASAAVLARTQPELQKRSLQLNALRDDSAVSELYGYGTVAGSLDPHTASQARSSAPARAAVVGRTKSTKPRKVRESKSLVRRVNRHSMIVLEDSDVVPLTVSKSLMAEAARIRELEAEPEPETIPLEIIDTSAYFSTGASAATGQCSCTAGAYIRGSLFSKQVAAAPAGVRTVPDADAVLDGVMAASRVRQSSEADSHLRMQQMPTGFVDRIVPLDAAVTELLRHFWNASANSLQPKAWPKLDRIMQAMGGLEDRLAALRTGYAVSKPAISAVDHLLAKLTKAKARFEADVAKRASIPMTSSGAKKKRKRTDGLASTEPLAKRVKPLA